MLLHAITSSLSKFDVKLERFFYLGMPGPGTGSPPPFGVIMLPLWISRVMVLSNVFGIFV